MKAAPQHHRAFLYHYLARVTGVYDGDSITVDVDLGFKVGLKKIKIRLFGINAPEVRGETRFDGLYSRDILRDLILHEDVVLQTYYDRTGKYGRWLAVVWHEGVNVNEYLVDNDLAEIEFYGSAPLQLAA